MLNVASVKLRRSKFSVRPRAAALAVSWYVLPHNMPIVWLQTQAIFRRDDCHRHRGMAAKELVEISCER